MEQVDRKGRRENRTNMDVRFLLLILLFVASCMPDNQASRKRASSAGSSTAGGTTGGTGTESPNTLINWNYLGVLTNSIVLNASNLNNAYITGSSIENFLSIKNDENLVNFTDQNYCLVSRYKVSGTDYELRNRVIPISYYDFSSKRTVRVLRVDFNDTANSTSTCNYPLFVRNPSSTGDYLSESSPTPKFDTLALCPTCSSVLVADPGKVRIFKSVPVEGKLLELSSNEVNLTGLSLSIDPNNNTTIGNGSCSNSFCLSRGFNCCLDNQCVKDGATRPSAELYYSTQLKQAETEKIQNPLAYLNYPHLYYICGTSVPSNGGSTTGGTTGGSTPNPNCSLAQNANQPKCILEQKVKDNYCIKHIKTQTTSTPFHNDLVNPSVTFTENPSVECKVSDTTSFMHYKKVFERLYKTCGCSQTSLDKMVTYCPAYEYKVNADQTLFECYTPPSSSPTIPSQQTVSVNSRSAPHRFFNEDGNEVELASSPKKQEGDEFYYQDDSGLAPYQQSFSMNAILGQMSLTLDQALPAKAVNVEHDKVYLISTTSGYYTPCPTCSKDSWFQAFTAFPSTPYGSGLQAIGHTTQRDVFSTNSTAGNYEDTIFGRACWLPPTMIPFSHLSNGSVSKQRQDRLKTQAALFSNGYQRDWFGFNKGALIGSFDGVTWFAVGKGRIVKSTSKKLFLAINAPFADLASPTLHVVNVQAYDGFSQAAQVDYDPRYSLAHAFQNEAGNCQANHLCSTDTDCITRLGWEYMCADVKDVKTNWPKFKTDGSAIEEPSSENLFIEQILQQKSFPAGATTKRCVYRGMGSVCHTNPSLISDLNKRKTLSCAPNFYCERVTNPNAFNSKVARFSGALEDIPISRNHIYGKDANVLGRPLHYTGLSTELASFDSIITGALNSNLSSYESTANGNTGICKPGKALPNSATQTTMWDPFRQHQSGDSSKRADFINQIASCNSTLFTPYRHSSCPVIDKVSGNYLMFNTTSVPTDYYLKARNQNACGLETLLPTTSLSSSADVLQDSSPFKQIEAKPLISQLIAAPTLVRDACLRRAGQVCHTDLDCSPNKFHANETENYSTTFFGNTAEKSYYSEYLVCGQLDPQPLPSDTTASKDFSMSKNVCCREVGKDFTTYTADIPLKTNPVNSTNLDTNLSNDSYDSTSFSLRAQFPGQTPNDRFRYSRLATVEDLALTDATYSSNPDRPILTAFQDRDLSGSLYVKSVTTGNVDAVAPLQGANVMTKKQWKTLSEANSENCCGGGWIRKFSDGTNDWTKRNRVILDVSNFRCLNSRTPILTNPSSVASEYGGLVNLQTLLGLDYGEYCQDVTGTDASCAQYGIDYNVFPDSMTDYGPIADSFDSTVEINTVAPKFGVSNLDFFFSPRSADSDPLTYIDLASTDTNARRNISIRIPSYISNTEWNALSNIYMIQEDGSASSKHLCTEAPAMPAFSSPSSSESTNTYCTDGTARCCYRKETSGSTRKLRVIPNIDTFAGWNGKKIGVYFEVRATGQAAAIPRTKPGSNSYYLRRLALLELVGIPQITYPELTCNDDSNILVSGLYTPTVRTKTDFRTSTNAFLTGGQWRTNQHGLSHEPVFSANDFKCCTPLGKNTTDVSRCCSGFGRDVGTAGRTFTCALPPGADLMVYFNRFVSNEGRGTEQPGGGLKDEEDFDELTGEPLTQASTIQKIAALGDAYCSTGKVRQGGAFGKFPLEPFGSKTDSSQTIYGIVDSSRDVGENSNASRTVEVGYYAFMDGFRWNNHLYCDD